MDLEITLRVNGATHQLSVDTRTTLLDALRKRLGLTGAKKGCDLITKEGEQR
jgi:xanthine dehydrogenase YagT iron-sulfur-binding subunit